ncbi:GDSL-type esterase/lipase family protein [Leuconostocaceae bacterium ESL0958]|nr:GDSL-type esterase/lipase family protein [Leuconostocaceae bacterium ESL0958]
MRKKQMGQHGGKQYFVGLVALSLLSLPVVVQHKVSANAADLDPAAKTQNLSESMRTVIKMSNGQLRQDGEYLTYYRQDVQQFSTWATINDRTYYFDQTGHAVSGLQSIDGHDYYFGDDATFRLRINQQQLIIDGNTYQADQKGILTKVAAQQQKQGQLWGFGDSTTVGWNPYDDSGQSFDVYAAKDLDQKYVATYGISGTQITKDMTAMTDKLVANPAFKEATNIVVGLGVNDVSYGNMPLDKVAQIYQDNLERIHAANPAVKIYLLLPQGNYLNGGNNDTIHAGGYSMNQLKQVLREIGQSMGLPVIDAGVVNDGNHNETIPDGVHPTKAAYEAIGHRVAQVIQENPNNNYRKSTKVYDKHNLSGYYNTAAGWRWLENDQVFTGFRKYAGTYYWFDKGIRQENSWHEAWGMRYYVGADGRAVQGFQNINGHLYYFGDDGTFYMRRNMVIHRDGQELRIDQDGRVQPWSGYIYDGSAQNGGYRWYENGQLFTGFRYYYGTYYWFVDGVRQNEGFRQAWGMTYYTDRDGRAVQGVVWLHGSRYDFGHDGTYYLRSSGYLWDGSPENGGYRWYENGRPYTGFRYYYGTYYWFINGVRQNAGWRQAWGMTYYTDQDGRAVQGWQRINQVNYYFGDDGTYYLR